MDVSTNSVVDFEVAVTSPLNMLTEEERIASRMRGMGASARRDDVGAGYRDGPAPVHSAVEELSLAPPMFSGASRVDADAWLHRFIQYVDYKRLGDEQKLQLFKLLMTDAAADCPSRRSHTRFPRCGQEIQRPLCRQRCMQER